MLEIRQSTSVDIPWIKEVFTREWGGEFVVTRGKVHKPEDLPGIPLVGIDDIPLRDEIELDMMV